MTAIDLVWLGLTAKALYAPAMDHLSAPSPNWLAAAVCWAVLALCLKLLVLDVSGTRKEAMMRAAILGFSVYATYNLTNLATLRDWSQTMSLVDTAWGASLLASTTWLVY
jgi:uncharacterized membrane protein